MPFPPSESEPKPQVTVALIDHRHLVRDCFAAILSKGAPDIDVYGFAHVSELNLPSVSLVAVWIDQSDEAGLELLKEQVCCIRGKYPDTPVVALVENNDIRVLRCAVQLGVALIALDSATSEIVIASLRLALVGGKFASNDFFLGEASDQTLAPVGENVASDESSQPSDQTAAGTGARGITAREMEVLQRLDKGLPNKIIAYDLGISESTVKIHLRNIMRKLQASNRTQVAVLVRDLITSSASER